MRVGHGVSLEDQRRVVGKIYCRLLKILGNQNILILNVPGDTLGIGFGPDFFCVSACVRQGFLLLDLRKIEDLQGK
jgi:hypothetical protein